MLDQYQVQLTRMLEAEQYREARELLRFLLQCQGQERRHYEEWESLLGWLEIAFPGNGAMEGEANAADDDEPDEDALREQAMNPPQQDEAYIQQVLYVIERHPMLDQQMLALERAVYISSEKVDPFLLEWLQREQIHPIVQFKALQCLRRRGCVGSVRLNRMDESVELIIEETPLSMEEFPSAIHRILERVEDAVESEDPTLPHFARELWKESLQFLYGTMAYSHMLREEEGAVDCYAAALHLTLQLTVYGTATDDDIRDAYGIAEGLRFRYEQACRTLRGIAVLLRTGEDEHEP